MNEIGSGISLYVKMEDMRSQYARSRLVWLVVYHCGLKALRCLEGS